jgi:hypothetical protein
MDMRFGLWNERSLYRAGTLITVTRELLKYKLDLVEVQEVRWEGGGAKLVGKYTFFYGKRNENHEVGSGFFLCKRVEFVSYRMSFHNTKRLLVSSLF